MNAMIRHIEYLVSRHDCVVVPGWGAFVAARESARIDEAARLIYPPQRSLRFNADISHNDGLLAASISRREGVSYDAACAMIADEVKALRSQMLSDGEVAIGRLGLFTPGADGATPIFTPLPGAALTAELRMLEPVEAVPVMELVRRQAMEEGVAHSAEYKPALRIVGRGRRWVRVAASIALLLGIGLVASTPLSVDVPQQYEASMGVKVSRVEAAVPTVEQRADIVEFASPQAEPQAVKAKEAEVKEAAVVAPSKPAPEKAPVKAKATAPKAKLGTSRMADDDAYIMVVASLPSQAKAEEYIASQRGACALAVESMDGRYRVYAATGATSAQARSEFKNAGLEARYPSAWPCKRH